MSRSMFGRDLNTVNVRCAVLLCLMSFFGFAAATPSVHAETLNDALARAYIGNPTLNKARATLRSVDEGVPQARAQSRPSASVVASAGRAFTHAGLADTGAGISGAAASGYPNEGTPSTPRQAGISVTQPLYRGGAIDAGIEQAEAAVLAQRAALLDTEQTVLQAAATAYLDVVQAQALLDLQTNFETVQKRDLEVLQGRYRVGEVTLTDVNLQEALVASAAAARVSAESMLATTRSAYAKVIGAAPDKAAMPKLTYPLPANLGEAVATARSRNPQVVAALHTEKATRAAVDVADAGLLPSVGITASAMHADDSAQRNTFSTVGSLVSTVSIPLDGGALAAKARAARQNASAARINIEEAERGVEDAAIAAWQALATARANIASYQAAVKANELAVKGMRQQVSVGTSMVIDMLNSEQTLLTAQVNLVKARHDEGVSIFALLAAIGSLSAQALKLPVNYYDHEAHYRAVRDRWFGYGSDE